MVGLAGSEDALPLADPLQSGAVHVPDGDVLRLGSQAERPAEVEEQEVVGVLVPPATLSSPGGEVKGRSRPQADG
jgi:hypothetical protein